MTKFKNKYRIQSSRAQWWDYGCDAAYFITICTQNRENLFGEICQGKMNLSPLGAIANVLWYEIPNHSKIAKLGEFIVMPNHVHGVLIIDTVDNTIDTVVDTLPVVDTLHAETLHVETLHATSLRQPSPQSYHQSISPKSNTVSSITRSYKSAVTRHANRLGLDNGWQSRYHDHIIRNEEELQRISNYIINNPNCWDEDSLS